MATRPKTTAKATEEEAAKVAGRKVQVTALQTIRCDGKTYSAGDPVPVDEGEVDQLVAAHVAAR